MNSSGRETYDLAHFTLADMVRCGIALRQLASQSGTMEEAAQNVVRYLFEHLWDPNLSRPCSVLVRLFKTHPFSALSADIKEFANSMAGDRLSGETRCLTLLGTAGEAPAWNSRRDSKGHQAIPLLSEA